MVKANAIVFGLNGEVRSSFQTKNDKLINAIDMLRELVKHDEENFYPNSCSAIEIRVERV